MRKTYLFLLLTAFCSLQAFATVHTVTVSNFQFSPATITNVQVGDTIKWVWSNGGHNTTSAAIPAGAASWAHAITQTSATFLYKVTTAGQYNYTCTIHAGMAGSFSATGVSAVPGIADAEPSFTLKGNVVSNELKVDYNLTNAAQVNVRLYNLIGRLVRDFGSTRQGSGVFQETYSVGDLPKGLYLLSIEVGGQQTTRRVIIE